MRKRNETTQTRLNELEEAKEAEKRRARTQMSLEELIQYEVHRPAE